LPAYLSEENRGKEAAESVLLTILFLFLLSSANARTWTDRANAQNREQRADFRRKEPLLGDRHEDGFTRNVNDAAKFEQQTQRSEGPSYKLFVSNLSWNVTYQKLLEVFKPHGAVRANIVKDRVKDRSRGYGFVTFPTEAAMHAALQATTVTPLEIDGRNVTVKLALERAFAPEAFVSATGAAEAKPAA
jgi:RNA recognition motif-containing protein